jgi:hypothetical protein
MILVLDKKDLEKHYIYFIQIFFNAKYKINKKAEVETYLKLRTRNTKSRDDKIKNFSHSKTRAKTKTNTRKPTIHSF